MPPRASVSRVLALAAALSATAAAVLVCWRYEARLARAAEILSANEHAVVLDREMNLQFGVQNPVVWVIAVEQGTVWRRDVLTRVQGLTRDVFRIPGVIAPDVISLASPNMRDFVVDEDVMEPIYLMGRVPETDEQIAALRRRVETNDNYNGTLVSLDGRAAMIVADFRAGAAAETIAAEALRLRDLYRSDDVRVYVAGAPVLGAVARHEVGALAAGTAAVLLAGLIAFGLTAGWTVALLGGLAAVVAAVWTVAVVVVADAVVWPWTGYALLPIMLVATALATARSPSTRLFLAVGASLLAAFAAMLLVTPLPAGSFAIAAGVGTLAALAAAWAVGRWIAPQTRPRSRMPVWLAPLLAIIVVVAAAGLFRLRPSFGLFGYGVRYLPAAAAADLEAVGRHFPPPSALAVQVHGDPGFVKSPEVIGALDAATRAVRDDPAVVRALSLADLIKIVNRAFHQDQPAFEVVPNEPGMIGRYLALAYSPGFRRFVDRAFSQSAIWVYLASDDPTDLERVRAKLAAQLAARPIPGAEADLAGGDGAVVIATWSLARRFAFAVVIGLGVFALGLTVIAGWRAGLRSLIGALSATIFLGGLMGWLGLPVDLLSLPLLATALLAAGTFAALGNVRPLGISLAVAGVVALAIGVASGNLFAALWGLFLLAPALGEILSSAIPPLA